MTSAPSLVPYLAVADGRRALEWYVDVLGARRRGEPIIMPDGRLGHAELELGESVLYRRGRVSRVECRRSRVRTLARASA